MINNVVDNLIEFLVELNEETIIDLKEILEEVKKRSFFKVYDAK